MMEDRKCKNKKCQRSLPKEYKYRYCENCRNARIKRIKDTGKAALGVVVLVVSAVVALSTNDKDES